MAQSIRHDCSYMLVNIITALPIVDSVTVNSIMLALNNPAISLEEIQKSISDYFTTTITYFNEGPLQDTLNMLLSLLENINNPSDDHNQSFSKINQICKDIQSYYRQQLTNPTTSVPPNVLINEDYLTALAITLKSYNNAHKRKPDKALIPTTEQINNLRHFLSAHIKTTNINDIMVSCNDILTQKLTAHDQNITNIRQLPGNPRQLHNLYRALDLLTYINQQDPNKLWYQYHQLLQLSFSQNPIAISQIFNTVVKEHHLQTRDWLIKNNIEKLQHIGNKLSAAPRKSWRQTMVILAAVIQAYPPLQLILAWPNMLRFSYHLVRPTTPTFHSSRLQLMLSFSTLSAMAIHTLLFLRASVYHVTFWHLINADMIIHAISNTISHHVILPITFLAHRCGYHRFNLIINIGCQNLIKFVLTLSLMMLYNSLLANHSFFHRVSILPTILAFFVKTIIHEIMKDQIKAPPLELYATPDKQYQHFIMLENISNNISMLCLFAYNFFVYYPICRTTNNSSNNTTLADIISHYGPGAFFTPMQTIRKTHRQILFDIHPDRANNQTAAHNKVTAANAVFSCLQNYRL